MLKLQKHREEHGRGEAYVLEITYKQNTHENSKKKPHTEPPNHTFKHSPKHRNGIWLMYLAEKNIKTKGGGAGTKADHINIIYKQNANENIKKNTHT